MKRPWLSQYVGTHSSRQLARAERALAQVESLGRALRSQPERALKARARGLKERARGGAPPDELLLETFALVREASHRRLGMRHFDVQVLAGVILHRGHVAELKTGEGKTLAATLPVVLHTLSGRGAHVVTVSDYLAQRDAGWMQPIYDFFDLSVGVVTEGMDRGGPSSARKRAYACDITYVTNHELVFDYLHDQLADSPAEQVHRPFHFALLDELDLLLLDEATMPLIISGDEEPDPGLSLEAHRIASTLREGEGYRVDAKTRQVTIEEAGWAELERRLQIDNLAAAEHLGWRHALYNALMARAIYQRDEEYIVRDGEVLLIDEHTGRVSPDKRLSDGLHQALEVKEGLSVRPEARTLARISYQMFFRLYPSLCGMTGTAHSAREELRRAYGLSVVVIPPNRPSRRRDEPTWVFRTAKEKLQAVADEVECLRERGRPTLIGTTSVKESERLSRLLAGRAIPHDLLNAKDDAAEAAIIARAGRPAAVTISTNMAGRGVDIQLGGAPNEARRGAAPGERAARERFERDQQLVRDAGGLMVLGTGLHESRRIDDQLRGRAGRQGDPGGSHYFVSLDDPVYRKFGQPRANRSVLEALRHQLRHHPRGEPIREARVWRTLEQLRREVELENQVSRHQVLRQDLVVDRQRSAIYAWRQLVLEGDPERVLGLLGEMVAELAGNLEAARQTSGGGRGEAREAPALSALARRLSFELPPAGLPREAAARRETTPEERTQQLQSLLEQRVAALRGQLGTAALAELCRGLLLATLDELWTEHLGRLEHLDDAVGLAGYGEVDPLLEFEQQAHRLFSTLRIELRARTVGGLLGSAQAAREEAGPARGSSLTPGQTPP